MKSNRETSINLRVVRFGRQLKVPFSAGSLDPHPKDLIENLGIIRHIQLAKSFFSIGGRYGHRSLIVETESHQKRLFIAAPVSFRPLALKAAAHGSGKDVDT